MKRSFFPALFTVLIWSARGVIAVPISTTQPAQMDSPLATILAWQDQFENSSTDDVMSAYACNTDEERATARIIARECVAASHLIKAARDRWGADAEQAVAHECQSDTRADDMKGHVSIDGDHATITFDGDMLGKFLLIRTSTGWKMDVAAYEKEFAADMQSYLNYSQRVSPIIEKAVSDVNAGKYDSAKQLIADLDKPLNAP